MNRKIIFCFTLLIFFISGKFASQTYQLTGPVINTTGWTMVAPTIVGAGGDFIQLTPDTNNSSGSIRLNEPINLKYCDKWRIEFDFRMDSNQNYNGDGIAFWYLQNPPTTSVAGSGIGVSQNAIGLVVGFDTFNNATGSSGMSKVHVGYGQILNTTDSNNIEFFNIPGSSFHSPNLNSTLPFQGQTYKHVEVTAEVDPTAPSNWIIKITIDGTLICDQSFAPSGAAAAMTVGYFGFSASTGDAKSRHSIKDVKVYVDKVPLLQSAITKEICPNTSGIAMIDLTTLNSQLNSTPNNYTIEYYIAGTQITNPTNFEFTTDTTISVIIKDPTQILCDNNDATITLKVAPTVTATDTSLRACSIDNNPSTGLFNLTTASVINNSSGIIKNYYPSLTDAENQTNEIANPINYIAPTGVVFIRVSNIYGCYDIAKVTLEVISQVFSEVLQDKIICIENTTTLDAGPGFTAYEWSTGATTQVIDNVGVGTYWVKLKSGECVTTQTVKIYASEQPVISSIDVTNNNIITNVIGGTAPYQYSIDGIVWQDSNEFSNIPRGDIKVYVKDSYICTPIIVTILVPNFINVITPNGDGMNDGIDYSALSGKQNLIFNVFNRYGTKIHQANKINNYKWDGTTAGKKVPTGNYWFTASWNENNKKNTLINYSGWIMVKNRN